MFKLVRDSTLDTSKILYKLEIPTYTTVPLTNGVLGSIIYVKSTQGIYIWTGSQWVNTNAVTLSSAGAVGGTPLVVPSPQAGPNLTVKDLLAGKNIVLSTPIPGAVTIACNALDSIPTNSWVAGSGATTNGTGYSIAIGNATEVSANCNGSTCIGAGAIIDTNSTESVIVGTSSTININSPYSVVVGEGSQVFDHSCIAIGRDSNVETVGSNGSICIGRGGHVGSSTVSPNSIGIGTFSNVNGANAVAVGCSIALTGANSVAIGSTSSVSGVGTTNAIAFGYGTSATASYATSIGSGCTASGNSAIAIGKGVVNSTPNTGLIGSSSSGFILGSTGFLHSVLQWAAVGAPSGVIHINPSSVVRLNIAGPSYDPYSAINTITNNINLESSQTYHATATVNCTLFAGFTPHFDVEIVKGDSLTADTSVNIYSYQDAAVSAGTNVRTITLSAIVTTSANSGNYCAVRITTYAGCKIDVATVSNFSVHRIN